MIRNQRTSARPTLACYQSGLTAMGTLEHGFAEIRKAQQLDPVSEMNNITSAYVFYLRPRLHWHEWNRHSCLYELASIQRRLPLFLTRRLTCVHKLVELQA